MGVTKKEEQTIPFGYAKAEWKAEWYSYRKNMNGDVFHILNRGVEKRKIFITENDYFRFVHNLYDFNDKNKTIMSYKNRRKFNSTNSAMRKPNDRELVSVLCWCLMPNHYHLLVQEKHDGGASTFSKKISSGYTQYFNLKNQRSGVLFQGRSKIILVKQEQHFARLPYYIFSNPIKLIQKDWKEKGIKNSKEAISFLENYRWSSYIDTIGKNNFPFIVDQKKLFEFFITSKKDLKKNFSDWLFGYAKAE